MGPFCNHNLVFANFLKQNCNLESNDINRFVPRNFLLDENVATNRLSSYDSIDSVLNFTSYKEWKDVHAEYLRQYVSLPSNSDGPPNEISSSDIDLIPDTFRFGYMNSPYGQCDDNIHLIRVEEVDFIAKLTRFTDQDTLMNLALDFTNNPSGTSNDNKEKLSSLLLLWNREKDLRPVFSGFWEDVSDLFGKTPDKDQENWPDMLRNRLGLGHLDPATRDRKKINIIVFRYPVGSLPVFRETKTQKLIVCPTVLDSNFSTCFCPAPAGADSGFTVNFDYANGTPCGMREVLHPAFPYDINHVWRAGTVNQSWDQSSLNVYRASHLARLAQLYNRSDYANETDGDILL